MRRGLCPATDTAYVTNFNSITVWVIAGF